jgi:hypothetical protein
LRTVFFANRQFLVIYYYQNGHFTPKWASLARSMRQGTTAGFGLAFNPAHLGKSKGRILVGGLAARSFWQDRGHRQSLIRLAEVLAQQEL